MSLCQFAVIISLYGVFMQGSRGLLVLTREGDIHLTNCSANFSSIKGKEREIEEQKYRNHPKKVSVFVKTVLDPSALRL